MIEPKEVRRYEALDGSLFCTRAEALEFNIHQELRKIIENFMKEELKPIECADLKRVHIDFALDFIVNNYKELFTIIKTFTEETKTFNLEDL